MRHIAGHRQPKIEPSAERQKHPFKKQHRMNRQKKTAQTKTKTNLSAIASRDPEHLNKNKTKKPQPLRRIHRRCQIFFRDAARRRWHATPDSRAADRSAVAAPASSTAKKTQKKTCAAAPRIFYFFSGRVGLASRGPPDMKNLRISVTQRSQPVYRSRPGL